MFVELDDFKLHCQVIGEGKPILFLHGLFGISDGMMEIFEPIFSKTEGWKRIYLDSPGNGKSDAPDWITSSDHMLDAVESFIDQVISQDTFTIAGYSYGGYLSLGLLHNRPAQLEGIMLLCPLIEPDESIRHMAAPEIRKVNQEYFDSLDTDVQKGLIASGMVVIDPTKLELADKVYNPAFKVANADFLNRVKKEDYKFSFDILDMDEFEKPSLILTGRQDVSVGYRDAWSLDSKFKRATFAVLDAAGHGLPIDQNIVFSDLVKDWLERMQYFDYDMRCNTIDP